MQHVRDAVTKIFWRDCYDKSQVPKLETMVAADVPLSDLSRMTGAERKAALTAAGVGSSIMPLFLRALQHVTAMHPNNVVEEQQHTDCFPPHSANHWAPTGDNPPLAGRCYVFSHLSNANNSGSPAAMASPTPQPSLSPSVRSPTTMQRAQGFIGLKNQGSTCYLNSLLQVLYHLTEFRHAIYTLEADEKSVTAALQKVFYSLECQDSAVETTELTTSFGWSSSDAFVQHDIHELTRILLDNLEEKLKAAGQTNVVTELFSGLMESFVRVKDVAFTNSHDEAFYDMQLVVQGCSSIYESLDKHFQPNLLEGNNRYCLELDGKKSYHDAEMGVRFKKCPPVLLCHLTRFDFDPYKGEMCKVLTRWDYYEQVDLTPYLPAGTTKADGLYTLHGVVVHSGADARFGHYYCFVKHGDTWLKFNDDIVTEVARRDVFGANFGGTKSNYWGQQIPLTTNAYMLVYVRTADLPRIVRRLRPDEIPMRLTERMDREREEQERRNREKAEEHMYVRVHFVTHDDLQAHPALISDPLPRIKFPPERTARVPRVTTGIELLSTAAEKCAGVEEPLLICGAARPSGMWRLQTPLAAETTIGSLGDTRSWREVVVAVLPKAAVIGSPDGPYCVTHHKVFLPSDMRCQFVCTLVVGGSVASHVRSLESVVRGHLRNVAPSFDADAPLEVVTEAESGRGLSSAAVEVRDGDVYVWQPVLSEEQRRDVFYATIDEFQHHLQNKTYVRFHKLEPPLYPEVHTTELALDLTYEQVQKYVAKLLGVANFDLIRFSRHNPETNAPFFMKIKKRDKSTLRTLLTSSQQLQNVLYFEIGKYTVTQMEESNPLIFEYFDDEVKPVSTHTILMPMPGEFTAKEMLDMCAAVIGDAIPRGAELRLLDVWQGKIYNIYTVETGVLKDKFEESSEYRVEIVPSRISGVPDDKQTLVHVQHITKQAGKVKTHGDPCSVYVEDGDLYDDFLERLSRKLKVAVQSMSDWKPLFVRNGELIEVQRDVPLATQLRQLLRSKENSPTNCYLGLDHAPLPNTRRQIRREERALKIYN